MKSARSCLAPRRGLALRGGLALFAAWLVPTAVLAQTTSTIQITSTSAAGTPPVVLIGKAACLANTAIPFTIDLGSSAALLGTTSLGVLRSSDNSNCSSGGALDRAEGVNFTGQTATVQLPPSELFLDTPDGGNFSCDTVGHTSASPATYYLCIQDKQSGFTGSTTSSGEIAINFATDPPSAPTAPDVSSGDTHLRVGWAQGNAADQIATFDVHVVPIGGAIDLSKYATRVTAQTNADVSNTDDGSPLQNDGGYDVAVLATDTYGNSSDLSPRSQGSPQAVADFYDHYRNDGGGALGGRGCSSSGGVAWIAALAFVVALLARRRRAAAASLLVFGLALALPAHAANYDRPPRRLLVEIKIDRYDPKVDSEASLGGKTPYADIFGQRKPLRYQLEADWQIAHPFGTLMLGATIGYWQNIGKGLIDDGLATQGPSQDTALLDVIPVGVVATYRFDWLADHYRWFPFIPYAQAGLVDALWASFSGTGSVSHAHTDGRRGSGWTKGYTTAVGVALNLDAIDPDVAREAYVDTYIQRTSLFAEYGWTRLDDFHKAGALILSDKAFRFGLALEF
jgi:uncharacterized protein (TIGR03382 family)